MKFKIKVFTELDIEAKDFRVASDGAESLVGALLINNFDEAEKAMNKYKIKPLSKHKTIVHVYNKEI